MEFKKEVSMKKINENTLAKEVSKVEGKKVEVNIAS